MITLNLNQILRWEDDQIHPQLERLGSSGRLFRLASGGFVVLNSRGGVTVAERDTSLGRALYNTRLITITARNGGAPDPQALERGLRQLGGFLLHDGEVDRFIPTVETVVSRPTFHLTGKPPVRRLVQANSTPNAAVVGPPLPTRAVDPSHPHLRTLFSTLNWTTPVHHANLLGFLLASFARPHLDSFPILLVDAYAKNSGKTRVARAIGHVLTGAVPKERVYTGNEDALEKRLGDLIGRPGPTAVLFDNVRAKRGQDHQIRSQLIAAMSTSPSVCIDTKYRDPQPIFAPVLVFTMNGAAVEHDLSDRAVTVQLGAWSPATVAPDVYAKDHLHELRAEVVHLLTDLPVPVSARGLTRHWDFEDIAAAATAKLGLPADFDPAVAGAQDPIARELYVLLTDLPNRSASLTHIHGLSLSEPGLKELNQFYKSLHLTKAAKVQALGQFLAAHRILDTPLRLGSSVVQFHLNADTLAIKETE